MPADFAPLVFAVIFFVVILLLVFGVMQVVRSSSQRRAMVARIQGSGQHGAFSPMAFPQEQPTGPWARVLGLLGLLGQKVASRQVEDQGAQRQKFLKAGLRSEFAPAVFWGAKAALAGTLALGFVLFRLLVPEVLIPAPLGVLIFSVLALAGFYIPNLWLLSRIQNRRQLILNGFPDALDLLVVCVQAGMGLDSAINRVAKETRSTCPTLSQELILFTLEIRAGMLRRDALRNLALRTDLEEMQNMVTLLLQTDKFGTSVSQALEVYSDSMRTQRMQRAEEKAAKLPIKILFPLMLFVFPSLFIVILGPAAIRIYRTLILM